MALDSQLVVLRVIVLLLNLKGLVNYCNLGLDSITLFRKYKKMTKCRKVLLPQATSILLIRVN